MKKTNKAAQLHSKVSPDWYHASIKRNLLQRVWHYSRFKEVENVIEPTKEIIGLDVLQSSVDWANKHWRNKKLKFQLGDVHNLKFNAGTFDAVFILEILEHVFNPQNILKEIKRVLKKNGYVVVLAPSDNKLFWLGMLHLIKARKT